MARDPNNNSTHIDTLELDPADGQQYILELRDRLLDTLAPAQTIEILEETLRKLYPGSQVIDDAIRKATKQRNESSLKKASASFTGALRSSVAKVSKLIRDGVLGNKSENELSKFKIAVIQSIIDDVLTLAGDFVKRQKGNFIITRSDIRTAMHADKDLMDMFLSDDKSLSIMENHPILAQISTTDKLGHFSGHKRSLTTYKQKVRSMVDSENSFIRGLKLIIKVFKAQLEELPQIRREVQIIFCNIEELLELSTLMLTALEDALESVGQEDEIPYVGSEIFDLAQAEEFHAYFTFAYKRLSRDEHWLNAYMSIVSNELTMTSIRTAGQSFDLAVRHLLPNYLLNTTIRFFEYFQDINDLHELSRHHNNSDDELALKETISILIRTKKAIEELLESEMNQMLDIEQLDPKQAETIRAILERRLDAELQHERNLPLPFMPPPEMYRFSEPDSKDNIIFEDFQNRTINGRDYEKHLRNGADQIPVIRCATLIKSFISDPEELLDLLIERFRIPDPPIYLVHPGFFGSPDDLPECDRTAYKQYIKRFRQEYSKPVKMRVINVLKSWIKDHYYDFEMHPTLLNKLNAFLDEVDNNEKVLRGLVKSMRNYITKEREGQRADFEFILSKEPPQILWWTAKANEPDKFDILTLHPVEFARQLTLVEFDLFRAIKPSELINVRDLGMRSRKDRDKYGTSPNLSRLTRHFTLLSYWVRKCIVETEDFDKRSAIYNRAIEIMAVLRDLNNYTGLLSIGSAIESAPISRLLHTKKTLPATTAKVMEDYRELNEDHQKKLQQELKRCNPPCIPYLGLYQTKLIHAKEGNKTFIDEVDTSTISPTLSNDEFHSSFSNSPATPISPRTPLPPRTATTTATNSAANTPMHNTLQSPCTISGQPTPTIMMMNNLPPLSAASTVQNQFFGGSTTVQPPPKMINFYKQRIRASLVAEISNYQNPPYCLSLQPEIRQYIESIETQMIEFALSLDPRAQNSDYWAEPSVPQMTKRLDDYLFVQSERIEPKNSTKPSKSKSKLPECWKSPGIKIH